MTVFLFGLVGLCRGLLELGYSRPFKLWLRLQRTNNKSDSVRFRLERPRADALKLAVRFSSGGRKEDSKRCKAPAKQASWVGFRSCGGMFD